MTTWLAARAMRLAVVAGVARRYRGCQGVGRDAADKVNYGT